MSNKKRFLSILFLGFAILLSLSFIKNPVNALEVHDNAHLQIESYQVMNFEANGITIHGKTKLNDSGWKSTNFGAHRSSVLDHGEVIIDGNIHKIENGKVTGISDISSIVGKKSMM